MADIDMTEYSEVLVTVKGAPNGSITIDGACYQSDKNGVMKIPDSIVEAALSFGYM